MNKTTVHAVYENVENAGVRIHAVFHSEDSAFDYIIDQDKHHDNGRLSYTKITDTKEKVMEIMLHSNYGLNSYKT